MCNDEANNAECLYDGGDCCGYCINKEHCSECQCLGQIIGDGIRNVLVGDGFCNDETNNENCNYDGFDCCTDELDNFLYCTECVCYYEDVCASGDFHHPWIGNGECNDETNIKACDYDGFDCCGSNVDTEYCLECVCQGMYFLH